MKHAFVIAAVLSILFVPLHDSVRAQQTASPSARPLLGAPPSIRHRPQTGLSQFENYVPPEFLSNASFEVDANNDLRPDLWKGTNLTGADGLVSDAQNGMKSVKLTGAAGVTKRLTQTIAANGFAGTVLTLDGYSKGDGTSASGGNYRVFVQIMQLDGTKSSFSINFTKGTHDWEFRTILFTVPKDFKKLTVQVEYINQTGFALFDNLHLKGFACALATGGTLQPNEGPTNYALYLQPQGETKAIMIFVDFPDAPASESTVSLHNILVPNSLGWYAEVSYGLASLSVTPVHKWYRMPSPSSSYGFQDGLTFEEHRVYITDAVGASDPEIDYSSYRILYVVSSNGAAIPVSPAFIAYSGDGVFADGVEIRHAATFGNDIRFPRVNYGSHVLIHETGHLFGLPDLYQYGEPDLFTSLRYVGGWDVMSWVAPGAHFTAWQKHKLGWILPTQVKCFTSGTLEATITPLETTGGNEAIVVRTSTSTAYVAEVRQLLGRDAGLCDKGILIYSVDASTANGYGPIRVQPAHNGSDPALINACGPLYDAPYDLGAGEISRYDNPALGLTIEILSVTGSNYKIRVTKN